MSDQFPVPPISPKKKLAWEKELTGIYVSEHPLQRLARTVSMDCTPLDQIDDSLKGRKLAVAGMVVRVSRITTRKGDEMAFMELEDLSGRVDIVVFPRTYEKHRKLLTEDGLLLIHGRVDVRDGAVQIISDSIEDYVLDEMDGSAPGCTRVLEVNLHCGGIRDKDVGLLRKAYQVLEQHPGSDRFCFNIISEQGRVQLDFPNATTNFSPELAGVLQQALGEGALHVHEIDASTVKEHGA